MADWTSDSNDALTLSLVRAEADKEVLGDNEEYEGFHPTFTYPIYGEDEKIYGYRDLLIDLRFASGSLAQYLKVDYAEKLGTSSTVDDPEGTLANFIPTNYYTEESDFFEAVEKDATTFKPLGDLIHSYTRPVPGKPSSKGKGVAGSEVLDAKSEDTIVFEAYHATWATPGFKEYHRRMQIFILLYIEGGSYIDEEEDIWEFVTLYEKRKRKDDPKTETYHFVGYSTLYPFYFFPEKTRMRLSQFVILTPYQHQGHGSELYKAIYQWVLSQPQIAELTVEDPAEAFEDLRDRNDLKLLLSDTKFMEEAFGSGSVSHGGGRVGGVGRAGRSGRGGDSSAAGKGKIGPPTDKTWAEKSRVDLKIAGRQFQRLIEMLILLNLDPADARGSRAYRLQVKERLYRFNFEVLAQLEKEERLEKLEETYQSVREDYQRILAMIR